MSEEHVTLKWGTLKSWKFRPDNQRAIELLQKLADLGYSMSAMTHHDTPEQKKLICELIDLGDFETVYLAWDGKEVSKDEAKEYVTNYGLKQRREVSRRNKDTPHSGFCPGCPECWPEGYDSGRPVDNDDPVETGGL